MATIEAPGEGDELAALARTNYSVGPLIDKERFTSPEYLKLENERLWSRTWNMVCRESEVREVGDYLEVTIAGESILVIREAPERLNAVSNVCRHRATHLKSGAGNTRQLRCPFHGWTYAFDGTLTEITREWDFPHVDKAANCLPSFQIDTWQGFVFVNLSQDAEPLRDFLEPIRATGELYGLDGYVRTYGVRIAMPCNWKLAQAAFFESYHFPWTHPQGGFESGHDATRYVLHGKHGQFIVDLGEEGADEAIPNMDLQRSLGHIQLFPNVEISNFFVSRWYPNGDDPDTSIMEVSIVAPAPEDGERPIDAPFVEVDGNDAEKVMEAWGLFSDFAIASNQDVSNLRSIQQGIKSKYYPGVILSLYQESLIRRNLEAMDEYLARIQA